jgi:hypothetical protein
MLRRKKPEEGKSSPIVLINVSVDQRQRQRQQAGATRYVNTEELICPGCGEQVSCEPPTHYMAAAGQQVPQFSHPDGSLMCWHNDCWAEPIEREKT